MSNKRYLNEDFDLEIKATPKKVDIKSEGDNADELEEFARCMFGDNFDFFSAFNDDDKATEEVDEPIDSGFEDEEEVESEEAAEDEEIEDEAEDEEELTEAVDEYDWSALWDDAPEYGLCDDGECKKAKANAKKENAELKELFNADLNIDAHDFGGSGNNVSVLGGGIKEECEDKKDLEELFDAKVNLDAHNFGGNNNDVSVLSPGGMISEEVDLDEGNIVKQYVHYNSNGTVDAIADTPDELAKMLGIKKMTVLNKIARNDPKFARVEYDEDDEFDDIDLDAYDARQAEKKDLAEGRAAAEINRIEKSWGDAELKECGPIEEKCENCEEELELKEECPECKEGEACPECEDLESMSKEDLIALVKELRK